MHGAFFQSSVFKVQSSNVEIKKYCHSCAGRDRDYGTQVVQNNPPPGGEFFLLLVCVVRGGSIMLYHETGRWVLCCVDTELC